MLADPTPGPKDTAPNDKGATRYALSLPIVAHEVPRHDPALRDRARALAEEYLARDPHLAVTTPLGPGVRAGLDAGPALVLEDHSWINLFGPAADAVYGYRARLLAGEGDLVIVGIARNPAFEAYCAQALDLGRVACLAPRSGQGTVALAKRCLGDPALIEWIANHARTAGGLNVLPYMGTGGIWRLAARIAERAGVELRVAAPPPRLTRLVNDKTWFARSVEALLGREAEPESSVTHGLAALTGEVARLARRWPAVGVKLPDSASSAGNIVLDSEDLAGLSLYELRDRIAGALRLAGWRGDFPLQVIRWERPIYASPSVQLWIPAWDDGDVVVEGIFDQQVVGPQSMFCGARPTSLPQIWRQRLTNQAACLGTFFQRLGYFGRCSLDSILVGESAANARLHWVECNGRWGGTSIPMSLANRLVGDWARVSMAVIERNDLKGAPWPFGAFLEDLRSHLFNVTGERQGAVVLSPSRIEDGSGFELLVIGRDADDLARRVQAISDAFESRAGRAVGQIAVRGSI